MLWRLPAWWLFFGSLVMRVIGIEFDARSGFLRDLEWAINMAGLCTLWAAMVILFLRLVGRLTGNAPTREPWGDPDPLSRSNVLIWRTAGGLVLVGFASLGLMAVWMIVGSV